MPHTKHSADISKHDKHAPVVGPTGLVDGAEYKYERVEKAEVDSAGHAHVVDVREDRGKEDPGMNYKDMRPPGLAPGQPIGVVPSVVTGTAPEIPGGLPGAFIGNRGFDDGRTQVVQETVVQGGRAGTAQHVSTDYDRISGQKVVTEKEKITETRRSEF